nr:unnamed protein product [Digitaria exilis]
MEASSSSSSSAAAAPPPPSIPTSSDQGVWADASPLLAAACHDLQDGELVHGENFSLFAAMSALEIMDPKMDSGIERSRYNSIEEAIEDGVAPIPLSTDRTLDVQCSIDVMDHLFSCEATWHKGHTLAQTVFTCIYLMRMERTSSHAVLNSFCRILRATCNAIISVVSTARTHEEEDFFTMSFGLPLRDEGDDKCLSILNSVEETISRQLRACKAQTFSKKKTPEDLESLQNNPDMEEDYCRAILCRLRFRKVLTLFLFLILLKNGSHFYHVVMSMRKPHGRGLELARKHVASCLNELGLMLKSREFLNSQSNITLQDDENCTTASGCQPVGFDVSLNSRLLSPTPPRAVKVLSWSNAIRYFEKLLHDFDVICALSLDPVLENSLNSSTISHSMLLSCINNYPKISLTQTLLVQDGKLYGQNLFSDVISRALSLPDIIGDKEFQMNEFVVQLGQLVINLLKILCTNTAWQRRKLGKSLQDWSTISIQVCELELALKREFGETRNVLHHENMCMRVSKQLLIWTQEQAYWRFMQHFDLLQKARVPEHISYYSFKESSSRAGITDLMKYNFFREIQKIIPSLRGSFSSQPEKLAELRQIEQVAEHNRIALNIISQVGPDDPSLRVSFEFTHHPHFAVAVVKRS